MKVAMTVTPGEAEYLDAHLAFHLNAGVDVVIAPAENANDDVRRVYDRYVRGGHLVRAGRGAATSEDLEDVARLAASELAADWLIVSRPTEFWWPRGETIGDVLVAVPPRYGVVQALVRDFLPRAGNDPFAERMTVRDSLTEASAGDRPLLNRLRPIWRLQKDVGLHGGQPLRAWYPVEVLRYSATEAPPGSSDDAIARGLENGSLAVDERIRDALRALLDGSSYRLPGEGGSLEIGAPTVVDDALYAIECAAVGEVNLDRLDRQIRDLEDRLAWLEGRFWPRVLRSSSTLLGRIRRRG